jgi:hypothetical protein
MDRRGETGMEALNSIIALLLGLAVLAERAAGRSLPVRWLVLWRIWQAEAVVRDFVANSASGAAGSYSSPVLATARYGADPADAMHLAASLRSLALIVRNIAAHTFRLSLLRHGRASARRSRQNTSNCARDAFIRGLGTAPFSAIEICDTS